MNLRDIHTACKWSTLSLGTLCALVIVVSFVHPGGGIEGVLIRPAQEQKMPWRVFEAEEIEGGVAVPESTNVIFHLPLTMEEIGRETLLGHKGENVRYWGYCFPQNYDEDITDRRIGLPGLLFLSEKERAVRERANPSRVEPTLSPQRLPTRQEIENPQRRIGIIRHQLDVFSPGMMCYVMAEETLALGTDIDGDGLNSQLEREIGTNPQTPDTDGDGIWDGLEYLTKTNTLLRDTDSDGLIDGIEDANWNGRLDKGETDPRVWDSDRDGLCDGFCRVKLSNGKSIFLGEDMNLSGTIDGQGETNPLKKDTDGDGLIDFEERLQCVRSGKNDC